MGEKGRINIALGILMTAGVGVIYSAIDRSFQIPPELWGLSTAAAAYLFTTGRRKDTDGT